MKNATYMHVDMRKLFLPSSQNSVLGTYLVCPRNPSFIQCPRSDA